MSNKRPKVFQVTEELVNGILFGGYSDTEEDLQLDTEDLEFLKEDINQMESNWEVQQFDVIIDLPTEKPTPGLDVLL